MSGMIGQRATKLLGIGAVLLGLSGCQFTMSSLAGPGNIQAMDAAVACDLERALGLAEGAKSTGASQQLFSLYVQYAVYMEQGQTAAATRAIDEATRNPVTNPDGETSRAEMQEVGDGILASIQQRRLEATGSATCP